MGKRLERILFLLLIFCIPIQIGKHFWPSFSFISGIRVDYLSPTIYLTDIVILSLFFSTLLRRRFLYVLSPLLSLRGAALRMLIFFICGLTLSTLLALFPLVALYGTAKLIEMAFLTLYIITTVKQKEVKYIIDVFSLSSLYVSGIAITQLILQHSLGGVFYFLGERTFNVLTPGIATIHMSSGLLLRPYSTFPHPNVLAWYLLCVATFILYYLPQERERMEKFFLGSTLAISSIVLFLTFSRITILCYSCILLYSLIRGISKRRNLHIGIFIFVIIIFFIFFSSRFFQMRYLIQDIFLRANLVTIAFQIFGKNLLFGVGINNFFFHEVLLQKVFSSVYLQPVHNIYLLTLSQLGIIGVVSLWFFLVKTFSYVKKQISGSQTSYKRFLRGMVLLYLAFLIVGMFDHFFFTLQQGQLLTSILIGFIFLHKKH